MHQFSYFDIPAVFPTDKYTRLTIWKNLVVFLVLES